MLKGFEIQNLRRAFDVRQYKLAALLDLAPITLSKIERGELEPQQELVERIRQFFVQLEEEGRPRNMKLIDAQTLSRMASNIRMTHKKRSAHGNEEPREAENL